MDLALNNQQRMKCHKTHQNNQPAMIWHYITEKGWYAIEYQLPTTSRKIKSFFFLFIILSSIFFPPFFPSLSKWYFSFFFKTFLCNLFVFFNHFLIHILMRYLPFIIFLSISYHPSGSWFFSFSSSYAFSLSLPFWRYLLLFFFLLIRLIFK